MIADKDGGVLPRLSERLTSRRSSSTTILPYDAVGSSLSEPRLAPDAAARGGYWVGELEGDTILESEYVLLMAFLGLDPSPSAADARGTSTTTSSTTGLGDLSRRPDRFSASVKAYFALKLVGIDRRPGDGAGAAGHPRCRGAHECNSFTRFYLALLGQIGYDECPCVPPNWS